MTITEHLRAKRAGLKEQLDHDEAVFQATTFADGGTMHEAWLDLWELQDEINKIDVQLVPSTENICKFALKRLLAR